MAKQPWDEFPDAPPPAAGPRPWDQFQDAPPAAPTAPDIGLLESIARGAGQTASLGFADELAGGIGALQDLGSDLPIGERYRKARDESRASYKAAEAANPKAYLGGQIGGGVLSALIPGALAARGAGLAARGGAAIAPAVAKTLGHRALAGGVSGAGLGVAQGAGSSEAEVGKGDVAGLLRDMAVGGGLGGVLGGTLPVAAAGLGAGVRAVGRKASQMAPEWALNAAGAIQHNLQKLSQGQQKELGQWLLDEGIITAKGPSGLPLGTSKATAVKRLEETLGKTRIGDILKEAKGPMDVGPVIARLRNVYQGLTPFEQPKAAGALKEVSDALRASANQGRTEFSDINALKAALGRDANWASNAREAAVNEAKRSAYGELKDELANQFAQSAGEDAAARLARDQRTWGNVQAILPTAIKGADREAGNAVFGPSSMAAGMTGAAAEEGSPVKGLLSMLATKALKERGPSLVAGALAGAGRAAPSLARAAEATSRAAPVASAVLTPDALDVLRAWLAQRHATGE